MPQARAVEFLGELRGGAGRRQIGRDHRRFGAEPAQLVGQGLHRLDAARAEHEIVAVPRQFARQRGADPA